VRQHVYTFDLMMPELELKRFIGGAVHPHRTVDIACLSLKRRSSGQFSPRLVRGSIGSASTAPGL
jgi:hypothetical protein